MKVFLVFAAGATPLKKKLYIYFLWFYEGTTRGHQKCGFAVHWVKKAASTQVVDSMCWLHQIMFLLANKPCSGNKILLLIVTGSWVSEEQAVLALWEWLHLWQVWMLLEWQWQVRTCREKRKYHMMKTFHHAYCQTSNLCCFLSSDGEKLVTT